jgi:hypothetical protein
MEAKARSFTFLANEGIVKIPFFQRSYIWTQENWEDLLDELLNPRKSHFLGSLILKQQKAISGDAKELLVIDGQQRLTTLSILLKVLFDSFSESLKENCRGSIRTYLFHKRQKTDPDYLIKIQHSHLDSQAFQSVIRSGIDEKALPFEKESSNKIIQCYIYFTNELRIRSEEERKGLFNKLLDSENKMIVVIDLTEADDEQTIFDTINSAGVRLTCADIIKNALFQKAIQIFKSQEKAIELYRKTWDKSFMSDEDTLEYWATQRPTGRFMRDNIEILLHSIAVIKGFYDPDIHTLSDLSKLYKEQIEKFKTNDELTEFINDIKEYAQIYRERILTFAQSTLFSFNNSYQRLFHILEVLQISTFHPFILSVLKNNTTQAYELLMTLEKFVIRRMISKQETKSFNKLCKEFIQNPASLLSRIAETTDDHFTEGLRNISNKNAALILFWVELLRRHDDPKFDTKDLKFNYSLEHIMPQKWEEHWPLPEKKNVDGKAMSIEEAKKDRNEKVDWIGNMTLLTSSLNSALRNYDFDKKVIGDGQKRGMKAYAALSITKDDIVAKFEMGDNLWDEDKIIRRTEKLSEEISQIWGTKRSFPLETLPPMINQEDITTTETINRNIPKKDRNPGRIPNQKAPVSDKVIDQSNGANDIVEHILTTKPYHDFRARLLEHKIKREKIGWDLIQENRNKYTRDNLNKIFDIVDLDPRNLRWFGSLIAMPNRNHIFNNSIENINRWIEELLFTGRQPVQALNICMNDIGIIGASRGLATLLLYLSNPKEYNVWLPRTERGLVIIGEAVRFKGTDYGSYYKIFNQGAIRVRNKYKLLPQEMDWILSFVPSHGSQIAKANE